jgi:hypothetical protein
LSTPEPRHLSNHHRDTLLKIFEQPTSHNIEWREVTSLVEAVGSVEETHGGMYRVVVGDDTQVVGPRRDKDVDVQTVLDLHRMLAGAGYETVVAEMTAKGKED